ncbi:MAG TPA: sigma-54 dependent transcriptional regulator [Longimicrobiaceae bacterium]|nr:sigma-54 dependent transcriptional regulator [Longimicrobiaceae bacterium]
MQFAASAAFEVLHTDSRQSPDGPGPQFVGSSGWISELRELVRRVAPTSSTVLITGESGTGKEVLARVLHARSGRADRPFVAVNCGALPEHLIEAEFFGYEKGAFTGANRSRPGFFEQAQSGTLFLDEITECSPALQIKLLRAIQEREIQRLGGTRRIRVDVRIIAATNRPLEEALKQGTFREDLYYRLRVIEMHMAPLRERKMDLLHLCRHFLQKYGPRHESALRSVSPAALQALEMHTWPGNVRELENAIERATVLAPLEDGPELLPKHLPRDVRAAAGLAADLPAGGFHLDLESAIERLRRQYISEALRLTEGNKTEAARLLGISRRGLYHLLD